MKSLQVLTKKNVFSVDFANVGQVYAKSYVDIPCVVRVIDEQGEAIGILHETIQNANKHIHLLSTTMGGMVQDLHNMGK